MNIRTKQKSVCLLPEPVRVYVLLKSTHSYRANFQVIFPAQPLSLVAFKVLMFSLLVRLALWPGWGTQGCSRIRALKGVISLVFAWAVSLSLNTFLGVFCSSPVTEVICYMCARRHNSLLKIEEAPLSRTGKAWEHSTNSSQIAPSLSQV